MVRDGHSSLSRPRSLNPRQGQTPFPTVEPELGLAATTPCLSTGAPGFSFSMGLGEDSLTYGAANVN